MCVLEKTCFSLAFGPAYHEGRQPQKQSCTGFAPKDAHYFWAGGGVPETVVLHYAAQEMQVLLLARAGAHWCSAHNDGRPAAPCCHLVPLLKNGKGAHNRSNTPSLDIDQTTTATPTQQQLKACEST